MRVEEAEKQWGLLTPAQQAALPAVVKRQGPTSANLAICWELGFDFDRCVPGYPMLSETPVRQRLGLSPEQTAKLDAIVASTARCRQEMRSGKTPPLASPGAWEEEGKKQVETILTPQQLAALDQIDFRRRVAFALVIPKSTRPLALLPNKKPSFSGSPK